MPAMARLPKRRVLGWISRPTFSMPSIRTLRWSSVEAAPERMRDRVYVSFVSTGGATVTFSHRLTAASRSLPAGRSEQKCRDDPCCGRAHRCGGAAKLGALEPGTARGPLCDPLWFFSRLRCRCAWGGAGAPVLRLSQRDIAGFRPGHRRHYLVCGGWAFHAGGGAIHGLLRLLLRRTPLLLRSFQRGSTPLFSFHGLGGDHCLVRSCSTPHRKRSSSHSRSPSGRGGTAQAPRRRNSQTQ